MNLLLHKVMLPEAEFEVTNSEDEFSKWQREIEKALSGYELSNDH